MVTSDSKKWTAVSGAITAGLAASACCVLPLIFLWIGISGAWIANLTALAEYHLWIVSCALLLLGVSYHLIFRSNDNECDEGQICSKQLSQKLVKGAFFGAAILIAIAAVFPYIVSWYYGV